MRHEKSSQFLLLMRTSFQATGPQIFQLSDIVEVQVSFITILLRGNKWKICTILRSISLFKREIHPGKNKVRTWIQMLIITQEAFVKSLTGKATPIENVKPTLKRRVGYTSGKLKYTNLHNSNFLH